MLSCLYFALRPMSVGRCAQTYEEGSNLSVFRDLRLFLQFFGQVKEWVIFNLHEMITMSHVVACPMVFILFCDRGRQEKVLNLMKNDNF